MDTFEIKITFNAHDRLLAKSLADWFTMNGAEVSKALIYRSRNLEVIRASMTRLQLEAFHQAWSDFTGVNISIVSRNGIPYERPRGLEFVLRPNARYQRGDAKVDQLSR